MKTKVKKSNPNLKRRLNENEKMRIIEMLQNRISVKKIAEKFGVSTTGVYSFVYRNCPDLIPRRHWLKIHGFDSKSKKDTEILKRLEIIEKNQAKIDFSFQGLTDVMRFLTRRIEEVIKDRRL